MTMRSLLLAAVLLAAVPAPVLAASGDAAPAPSSWATASIALPVLRASVTVSSDVVRVGDLIENAGSAALIAVYRSPDLGTTGALPVAQVLGVLRAKQVIGVDTKDIKEITVTRLARNVDAKDIQDSVARAIEHRGGLGDAANLSLTFDRDLQDLHLDASNTGAMQATAVRYDQRSTRFDIAFEVNNDNTPTPTKLRFTGTAIETVEVAVLTRDIERSEMLKSSDVAQERRPKAEVPGEAATRDRTVGMQLRRPMRAGQAVKVADLVKPDLVQRDQSVTLIYQTAGLYLTTRGKAVDSGTEGDVVNVLNLQSKRTVTGVVTGRGQVTVQGATPDGGCGRQTSYIKRDEAPAPVDTAALVRNLVEAPASPPDQFASRKLQARVKVHVPVEVQSLLQTRRVGGLVGGAVLCRQRMLRGQPPVADRRAAEADVDRQPDHAARLQAGADADAEAGSRLLQSELAVAQRQPRLLQGPARDPCRRPPDRDREHHRQGQHRQRDPA